MPHSTITPEIGRRIRALGGQDRSSRWIVDAIRSEFGAEVAFSTVCRYLKKHPPLTEAAATPTPRAQPPPRQVTTEPARGPKARDDDEVAALQANATRLVEAMEQAADGRELATIAAEHRKTLAAIRDARKAGAETGDGAIAARAEAVRERLRLIAPPSPPTHAERAATDAVGSAVPDEPRASDCG